jgi:Protein of unknown function (DUF1761)
MQLNFIVIALSGLIPMIVGFVWYNKNVMGALWMKESGVDPSAPNTQNMLVVLGVGLLFGFMLAISLLPVSIHPMGLYSMLQHEEVALKDPNSPLSQTVSALMTQYGGHFRTFKHGAFHGVLMSVFFALPVVGMSAIFERKSWKYVAVHVGYWAICLGLMGGVICAFA